MWRTYAVVLFSTRCRLNNDETGCHLRISLSTLATHVEWNYSISWSKRVKLGPNDSYQYRLSTYMCVHSYVLKCLDKNINISYHLSCVTYNTLVNKCSSRLQENLQLKRMWDASKPCRCYSKQSHNYPIGYTAAVTCLQANSYIKRILLWTLFSPFDSKFLLLQ